MRYLSLLLALSVVGLAGCDQALPEGVTTSAVTANAGSGPSASGAGHHTIDGEYRTFSFTVREKQNGVHGNATLQARQVDNRTKLDLECLTIVGNQAFAGGTVTQSGNPDLVGLAGYFSVVDNGEGSGSTDQISLVGFADFDPTAICDFQLAPGGLRDIEGGNIQVRP